MVIKDNQRILNAKTEKMTETKIQRGQGETATLMADLNPTTLTITLNAQNISTKRPRNMLYDTDAGESRAAMAVLTAA